LPPILQRFQVMADYWSNFRYSDRGSLHINTLAGVIPCECPVNFISSETRMMLKTARSYFH